MKTLVTLIGCIALSAEIIAQPVIGDESESISDARYQYIEYFNTVDEGGFRLIQRGRLEITNRRGNEFAQQSIWEDNHNRLTDARVTVYDSGGQVIVSKGKGDMRKSCGFGDGTIYDDACFYTGDFSASTYPYYVEYEWCWKSNSLFYLRGAIVDREIPVDEFSYKAIVPDNVEFEYYSAGIDLTPTVSKIDGGRSEYHWQARSISARPEISYGTPQCEQPARVVVIPRSFKLGDFSFHGDSWHEIGLWYLQLYQDRYLAAPESQVELDNPLESLKAIYDDVRQNIRYVAIEVGVGGWQPYKAETTQKRGFGDCKDMSTLLVSRLRNVGIEAYPVHVKTRYSGPLDTLRPQIDFNHVISVAVVGSDTVWMDPTCSGCPLGDLPYSDEAIPVVVSLPDGGRLWKTPGSSPNENLFRRDTRVHIDSDLNCSITCDLLVTGEHGRILRQRLRETNARDEQILVNRLFPGADELFSIDSYQKENLSDEYQPMFLRVKAHTRRPLNKIGSTVYCSPFFFNELSPMEKVPLEDRNCGIDLAYPDQQTDRITVTWDRSLDVDSIIAPVESTFECPSNRYILSVNPFADSVTLELGRICIAYEVPPGEFEEYGEYRSSLKTCLKQYVKLVCSAP